jgi:hypothetical protein
MHRLTPYTLLLLLPRVKLSTTTTNRATSAALKFDLTPAAAREYDPTFIHLSGNEHQLAVERVAQKLKLGGILRGAAAGEQPPWGAHPIGMACI